MNSMQPLKDIVILYHADCSDGFAAALAAYKKFGFDASYVPVRYQDPLPNGLEDKEIYIVDFSYSEEILRSLHQQAKLLVIMDHHKSAEKAVRSVPEHRFDLDHSGCHLAWQYFHPGTETPRLLQYVETGDLWTYTLPYSHEVLTFLYVKDFNFPEWEKLFDDFEDDKKVEEFAQKGREFIEYSDHLVRRIARMAEEVEFEGYKVYAVNAPHEVRSVLGEELVKQKGPFAIVWYFQNNSLNLSLRGDGTVDLTKIVGKYGGGGHKNSAGIRLAFNAPLPFKRLVDRTSQSE